MRRIAAGLAAFVAALTLLTGIALFDVAAAYAAQAPWPMALHHNRHSGTSSVDGPTSGHVLWTRDLQGNITPGPAVGSGGVDLRRHERWRSLCPRSDHGGE